jgi:Cd2+/Zn2+-exporting ATPase
MDPTVDQTIVRSTILCKGICCSSEVPELLEILTPVHGIAEVKVNVPLKTILIDHDSRVISATQIVDLLEEELFPSTVERDGGASLPSIVRSTFSTKGICCSSEVPSILGILTPYEGIFEVKVSVPVKQVVVDHDCKVISAAQIATILCDEEFETTIQKDGGASKTVVGVEGRSKFLVGGICCSSEIPAIRTILEPLKGVKGLLVTVGTKMVYVDHSANIISTDDIVDALKRGGFEAVVKYDCFKDSGGFLSSFVMSKFSIQSSSPTMVADLKSYLKTFNADQIEGYQAEKKKMIITIIHNPLLISAKSLSDSMLEATKIKTIVEEDGNEGKIWNFPETTDEDHSLHNHSEDLVAIKPTIALSGVFWIIAMFSKFGGGFQILSYFGLVSVAFGIPPIATKAFRTARRGMIDTNVLMFLAVVGAISLKQFDEAAAVTFLFSLSEWLEARATRRANQALTSIVNLKPERANIIQPKTKELIVVPATSVPVGALVAVKSGDKIPCDGVIVEGNSTLDESSLTGESRPVKKGPKDEVSGGTVNSGNTQIVVRTSRTSDDSAVSRLIRLVEEAQANRSETEKIVDSFAKVYTPVVVFTALAMCTIPWLWGSEAGRDWMSRGLSLIVIACPCALVISTPISYVAGLAATAQNGVLVKGGAHLEALGQLKHVCFDKTGTLTVGEFKLLKLDVFGKKNIRQDVLQYLALMEDRATHPLAKSLVDGIKAEGVKIPTSLFVKDHTFMAGEGVKGSINGKKVYVGNERLFKRLGMFENIPIAQRKEAESWESMGGTIGFMSIEDEGVVCAYCVADAPRPESAQVLKELKAMGITIKMFTGDKRETALSIGQKIGMNEDDIMSELLPSQKLQLITGLKADIKDSNPLLSLFYAEPQLVLMCGDGVNDAPSLVVANVGVAMGEGAALAMETADVTLMDSNLTKLIYSIKMGRSVIQKNQRECCVFYCRKIGSSWFDHYESCRPLGCDWI